MSYPLEPDPYEALGVDKDADIATIRKAYRKLVFLCHPDRIRDENRQGASQEFEEVQTAYEILADETSRQRYDERVKLAKMRQEMRQESKVVRSRRDGYDGTDLYPYGRRASTWERKESRAEGDNEPSSYNDQVRKETRRYVGMFSSDKEYLEEYVSCATTYHYNWNPVSTSLREERRYRLERREREKERRDRLKRRETQERERERVKVERREIETRRARRSARNERRPQAIRAYSSQRKAIMSLEQHEKHRRQHEIFEQQRLRFLGIPPPIPKRLAKKPAAGILALEGFVNGNFVCTNPDTGAQANLIALAFAESIGLHLFDREPESQVGFRMANGNMIYSIGRAIARWSFKKGSSESYEISFYVFAECCFDVVIGDPFLRATRTMSTNEHRLSWIPRPKWALYVRRINLLGCPSQQMKGKLSGEEVFALADTGAEGGNLVSYDYAKRRGWLTSDLVGKRSLLQFPDGSQSRTEGQVRKVWRYHGALGYEKKITVVFDVLYDLPFNVILGQDFLQSTDAFNKHKRCFHDLTTDDDCLGISLVIWKGKKNDRAGETASATGASDLEQEVEDELERRATNNQKIRKVKDDAQRDSAERDETKRIEDWESAHPDIWRAQASPGPGSQPNPQRFIGTQPSPSGPHTLRSQLRIAA